MKRRTLYGLAAGLSFATSLILLAPAALVTHWLLPQDAGIHPAGVEGSLRDGSVAGISLNGRPLVERLHWNWRLRDLLLGRIGVDLDSSGATLIDGHLARGLTTLSADDLRAAGALQALMAAFGQPFVPLDGSASLQLQQLKLRGNWPSTALGTLRIDRLQWTLARDPLTLGSYEASFAPDGDDLAATVKTIDGALEVSGGGRAKADRSYELHLLLKPAPGAPAMLPNLLQSLGAADAQGYYHLRREGKLQ